MIKKYHPDIST